MELLALKCDAGYLKLTAEGYALVGLNKASVRPLEEWEELQKKTTGWAGDCPGLRVVKLIVTEEDPFTGGPGPCSD